MMIATIIGLLAVGFIGWWCCCVCKCTNTQSRCIDNKTSCTYQIEFFDIADQDCSDCTTLNSPGAVFVVGNPFPSGNGCAWTQAISVCNFTQVRMNLLKDPFGSGTVLEVILSGTSGSLTYQRTYASPINCDQLVDQVVNLLSDGTADCNGAGSTALVNSL